MASFEERRKDERFPFATTIEYELKGDTRGATFRGVIIDISLSGLCMYLMNPVPEGQSMTIKSTLPVERNRAAVRWIEQLEGDLYKAGVAFL